MTVLLVLGLIAFVIGMARTAGELAEGPGAVDVAVPAGAEVVGSSAGDGRLYLTLRHPDGRQSILVLDADDGRPLGELTLVAAP